MKALIRYMQHLISRLRCFLLLFLIITSWNSQAQVEILHEGFETDGEGTRYDSTWFKNITEHFTYAEADLLNGVGFTGATGSGVLTAGHVNNGASENPTDPYGVLVTKPVYASGFINIQLSVDIAANTGEFENNQDDQVSIWYAFDGDISTGSWTKLAAFLPDKPSGADLKEDTDLNGSPDGPASKLNKTLTTFTYNIPDTGSSVAIKLMVQNSQDIERVTFDELILTGDDVQSPSVASVAVPANDTYITGQDLSFTVEFDENVVINTDGGTPTLPLTVGGTTTAATYQSGSGTSSLVFSYTIQSGDEDTDGISLGASVALNGSTIQDPSGNAANLPLNGVPATTGIVVDAIAPAVTAVDVPTADTYLEGEILEFTVNFDENVVVDASGGTPSIDVTIGSATVNATYASGSGGSALVFSYTVQDGDLDTDGIALASTINLNSGTIQDNGGNNINTTLNNIGDATNVTVDAVAPAITSVVPPANGVYTAGENLDFTVEFDQTVVVNVSGGTPSIGLTIGGASGSAAYISGSGTSTIVFRYTVQANEEDTDGISMGTTLVLDGGTINDSAGNNAALTLPPPTITGIFVDAIAPSVMSFTLPANSTYSISEQLDFIITYDENVIVNTTGGTPYLNIDIGGTAVKADYISGSGTSALTFSYTIAAGDLDTDGIGITSPVDPNGGTMQDAAGNNADLSFTPGNLTGILVDGIIPEVTSVAVPANKTYTSGENLDFTVSFDDVVTVSGAPSLMLTVGSSTEAATYESGSGTNKLIFRYPVADGDLDSDGITIGSSIAFNGGNIQDNAGNTADNTLNNIASPASINVDAAAPVVTSVAVPPDDTYILGEDLKFTVQFDEPVYVTSATPYLELMVGATAAKADYVSGSGSTSLIFRYQVQPGDLDDNGIEPLIIVANGATLSDQYTNDADLNLNNVASTLAVKVDGVLPELSPDEMILVNASTIRFSLSEGLNLPDGAAVNGFTYYKCTGILLPICGENAISGIYSAGTNTVTLKGVGDWNASTVIDYRKSSGNVVDIAGNEMAAFNDHIVVKPPVVNMGAGDIAITSYSADAGSFSFVLMKDIQANTVINFTDKGWDGSKFVSGDEKIITWKSSGWLYAGTEIKIEGTTASLGNLSAPDGALNLSSDGDQLLAYQGTAGTPTFIAAIQMEGTAWLSPFDGNTGGQRDRKSALPSGLTDGVSALVLSQEKDNASYDRFTPIATTITSGTVTAVLASIMGTPANWRSGDNMGDVVYPDGTFKYAIEPEVTASLPVNGALVAGTTSQLKLTFGTDIAPATSTGNDILLRRADNTLIKSWSIISPEVEIVNTDLYLDLSGVTLTHNTTYKVDLAEKIIKDVSFGNYNEAFDGATNWSFTVDALNPKITSVSLDPAVVTNGSSTHGLVLGNDARFLVTFSEAVTGVDATDFQAGSSSGTFSGTVSVSANSATEYVVTITDIDSNTDLGKLILIFSNNSTVIDGVGNPTLTNYESTAFYTIIKDEPASHVSNFTAATGADHFTIDLSWNAPAAGVVPDGYLIEVKDATTAFAGAPSDLAPVANDTDFSDGYGVFNINSTSVAVGNLNSSTTYDFRIYPYTNSGDNIDYKTDGTVPEANALTSHASVSALTKAALANDTLLATINSASDPLVKNMVFSIKDDGNALTTLDQDNIPTLVNEIILTQGTGNDIGDWSEAIEGVRLRDKEGNIMSGVVGTTTITFSSIDTATGALGKIEDNGEKIYILELWLKQTLGGSLSETIDGLNFVFSLNGSNITTATNGSSDITPGAIIATEAARNEVVVEATAFSFVTSPAPIEGVQVPLNSVALVEVRDENGNLDLNYNKGYSLSFPSGSTASSTPVGDDFLGDGILDFSDFKYTFPGNGTLTIANPGMISATSTPVDAIGTLFQFSSQGVKNQGILPSPGVDQIIFGFYLDAYSLTADQPLFESIAFTFTSDITNVFENLRLFKVVNPSSSPILGSDAVIVPGAAINAGLSTVNVIVMDGFSEILEPVGGTRNYYYLVADISKNTYSGSMQVQVNQPDIGLSAGSLYGNTISGYTYTFEDVENPSFELIPAPGSINVSSSVQPQLIFDEPVTPLDSTFVVRLYADDSEVATINTLTGNADSTIFTFDPGLLLTDTKYYIQFQPGNLMNNTGFVDRAGKAAQGATTKDSWSFVTADAEPPIFTVTDPSQLIVNKFDLGFDLRIQLDEIGEAHYIVVENGQPVPTASQIFNPDIYGGNIIEADSFDIAQAYTYYYKSITGLDNNTDYTVYVVAKDKVPNKMQDSAADVPLVVDVTTENSFTATVFVADAEICVGDFQEIIEPIQLIEGDKEDMYDHGTFSFEFALPTGYVFDQMAGEVAYATGGEIESATLTYRNQTTAKISYTASGSSRRDQLTVTGLRIKADHTASSGPIELLGDATNGNFPYGTVVGNITLTAVSPVSFNFDPQQALYLFSDFTSDNPVKLVANPAVTTGTNVFSGPEGIVGDKLYIPFAGVGSHEITLLHTDENSCQSTSTKTIEIIDERIYGLESSYCSNDGSDIILSDDPDPNNPRANFRLVSLVIDTVGIVNPGDPASLTANGPDWDFSPQNAIINGADYADMNFKAVYERKSDPSKKDTIIQKVTIYVPEDVSLRAIDQQHQDLTLENNYCEDFGDIKIEGSPLPANPLSTGSFRMEKNGVAIDVSLFTDNEDGLLTINPQTLVAASGFGLYTIYYDYTNNETICSSTASMDIFINAKPVADFPEDLPGCVGQPLTFQNTSTIETTDNLTYAWNFDDFDNISADNPNVSSAENPVHTFATARTYNIELTAISDRGCRSDLIAKQVTVGNNPVPQFSYEQIGTDQPTTFANEVSGLTSNKADSIVAVGWDFNGTTRLLLSSDLNKEVTDTVQFQFPAPGVKQITLTVETINGCQASHSDSIFVVPVEVVTATKNYEEDFESGQGGWTPWGSNSSWAILGSGGDEIQSSVDTDAGKTKFWVTGAGTYNENQRSYVYSPIFDLSDLKRPMVSLDIFNNINPGKDGAVIEYSTTGYFGTWNILGSIGSGVGWYNTRDISNAAGDVNLTNSGWSANDSSWVTARHSLSHTIDGRVQFRVSFASGENTTNHHYDGFAFDNILIGERTRTVLIETFTNVNGFPSSLIKNENNYLKNFNTSGLGTEIVKINYHTDFPGEDPINKPNRMAPSARSLYYNINNTPQTIIDGQIYNPNAPFSQWGQQAFELRSLALAQFDIQVVTDTEQPGELSIEATITPKVEVDAKDLLIYIAVVEKEVDLEELGVSAADIPSGETSFTYILREMLPNAAGIKVSAQDLTLNVPLDPITVSFNPSIAISDLNDMAIIVFVQDEDTKEVYQSSAQLDVPAPEKITGTDASFKGENFNVYPNPVREKLNIILGSSLSKTPTVRIYDTFGQVVFEKTYDHQQNKIEIDTKVLSAGIYHIQVESQGVTKRERILIVH